MSDTTTLINEKEVVNTEYSSILTKGLQSALNNTPIEDGKLRFTTDTGRLYLDIDNNGIKNRIRISSIEDGYTEEEILAMIAPLPKIYTASDTGRAYISIGDNWVDIGPVVLEKASEDNKELVLWMSDKDADQPKYVEELSYNNSTKTFKAPNINASNSIIVGNMIITDTVSADSSHTVNFGFISA